MGQAVVDLPDPMEKPPASATSADDLLAQLAGDEIDRLLTESDAEAPADPAIAPAPMGDAEKEAFARAEAAAGSKDAAADIIAKTNEPSATSPDATSAPIADSAPPAETPRRRAIDKLFDEKDKAAAAAATAAAESHADNAAALDAVLSGASTDEGSKAASMDIDSKVAAEADQILSPHLAAARAAGDATAEEHSTTADAPAERDGLLAAVADEPETDELPGPLPLWLRPLEWINAPVNASSDAVREFLGKAAILTLVNSAAVIVYVLLFRKH